MEKLYQSLRCSVWKLLNEVIVQYVPGFEKGKHVEKS